MTLNDLTWEVGRLDYRAEHHVPWFQRFGLSQFFASADLSDRSVDAR